MITQLSRILTPSRCLAQVQADSRKRVLETISGLMANELTDVGAMDIFDLFIARERLGSTAMGHGVAIPHIRFAPLEQPLAALCQLAKPIPYEANDHQNVDLFFALLVPEGAEDAHIAILSQLATLFREETICQKLRQATNAQALYQDIMEYERSVLGGDDEIVSDANDRDS